MSTLKIERPSQFNNSMRDYTILVDGTPAGSIKDGETREISLSPGSHTVAAKIDWCSSPEVAINLVQGQVAALKVGGFKYSNWLMPLAGGIIGLHFVLKIFFQLEYLIVLVFPAFLFLVYYLTLGRKKFLSLEVVD